MWFKILLPVLILFYVKKQIPASYPEMKLAIWFYRLQEYIIYLAAPQAILVKTQIDEHETNNNPFPLNNSIQPFHYECRQSERY